MKSKKEYQFKQNDTTRLFQKLNTALYLCGFRDFWVEDVNLPAIFVRIYDYLSIFIEVIMFLFMALEVGAFFTQSELSQKQAADRLVFGTSHPILYIYCLSLIYYKGEVRAVVYQLAAVMKNVYNDRQVEAQMLRKLKFYLMAYVLSCGLCIVFYGASAFIQYARSGQSFTTVITAWPDVSDDSGPAHVARVVFYLLWWIYFTRVSASYILILSIFIFLSFQYRNLQSYFLALNDIFDGRADVDSRFVSRFEIGVKLHVDTLWSVFNYLCKRQCQKIFNIIFSAQLLQTVAELVSVMSMMISPERSVVTLAAVVATTCGALISTGFLMWNAGDVTVEAAQLPAAMYACGWQHLRRVSRGRHLAAMAITQAQQPVEFKALGFISISYETYLTIVKSSYSVFSVVY